MALCLSEICTHTFEFVENDNLQICDTNDSEDAIEPQAGWFHDKFPHLRWTPSSPKKLQEAEETLLSYVETKSKGWYVDCGMLNGEQCRIWTRQFSDLGDGNIPLVMMHGMAAGLALFGLNIDDIAPHVTLYLIDLPGFARSSRPQFNYGACAAEGEYVDAIDKWREEVGIETMHLFGHSFGGFLAAAYSLRHPNRVSHLIMGDPWGMTECPGDFGSHYKMPWYLRGLLRLFQNFNPLAPMRALGPVGPHMVVRIRPDLINKFCRLFKSEEETFTVVSSYIFHCNAHNPTGEAAYHSLMKSFAWAKDPMFNRLKDLPSSVPVTAIYGGHSWIRHIPQEDFERLRPPGAYTNVQVLKGASHHCYADLPEEFNEVLITACQLKPLPPPQQQQASNL